jgi:hypothetical protein
MTSEALVSVPAYSWTPPRRASPSLLLVAVRKVCGMELEAMRARPAHSIQVPAGLAATHRPR